MCTSSISADRKRGAWRGVALEYGHKGLRVEESSCTVSEIALGDGRYVRVEAHRIFPQDVAFHVQRSSYAG